MASSSKQPETAQMESFQSILQSLNIPDPTQGGSAKITPEMMQQLSQRIMGILGDSPAGGAATQSAITEDGLPVVEINEHEDDDTPPINARGEILPDDDLVSFDKLTPDQRAQQQDEVNRLLDELEKEEQQQHQIQKLEAQDWAERKKAESAERAKYGRATPVKQPTATSTSLPQPRVGGGIFKGAPQSPAPPPPAKKKSVHFDDDPSARYNEDEDDANNTGDLVFAQLNNTSALRKAASSASSSRQTLEKLSSITPMKLNVIERQPGKPDPAAPPPSEVSLPPARTLSAPAPAPIPARIVDSDDETPPATPSSIRSVVLDDSERPLTNAERREIEERHDQLRTNVELDHEELDALGRGRGGIGSGGWDEENVPLDATLSSTGAPIHKSSVSRFKAERIAASGGSVSVPEIIPAGALGGAIRMGHLHDEQKLEGNGDSDSDDDLWTSHADTFEALKNFGMGGGAKGKDKATAVEASVAQGPAPPVVSGVKERAPVRSIVSSSIIERPPRPRTNGAAAATVQAPASPAVVGQAVPTPKKISRFRAEKLGGAE